MGMAEVGCPMSDFLTCLPNNWQTLSTLASELIEVSDAAETDSDARV